MDIQLGTEKIYALDDRLGFEEARQKAMDRRTNAFGGGLGSILQRPKVEDIDLVASQRRLDPFWHVACRALYVYERTRDYPVAASTPEVREVTVLGTTYPVAELLRPAAPDVHDPGDRALPRRVLPADLRGWRLGCPGPGRGGGHGGRQVRGERSGQPRGRKHDRRAATAPRLVHRPAALVASTPS